MNIAEKNAPRLTDSHVFFRNDGVDRVFEKFETHNIYNDTSDAEKESSVECEASDNDVSMHGSYLFEKSNVCSGKFDVDETLDSVELMFVSEVPLENFEFVLNRGQNRDDTKIECMASLFDLTYEDFLTQIKLITMVAVVVFHRVD